MTAPSGTTDRIFVDTNILIYAHDQDAGPKRDVAAALVRDLWRSRRGVVSTQILQEFYVVATRRMRRPLARADARRVVAALTRWDVVELRAADTVLASEREERWQCSFWDALMLVAAERASARAVLTEDLTHGRSYGRVRVTNPFV